MPRRIFQESAAAKKSAAENDDHTRSPAAERLRRREEMCATIIMAAAYNGTAGFRQPPTPHTRVRLVCYTALTSSIVRLIPRFGGHAKGGVRCRARWCSALRDGLQPRPIRLRVALESPC